MVRIEPDPDRLRALGMSLGELQPALQSAEAQPPAGALVDHNQRTVLEATGFILQAAGSGPAGGGGEERPSHLPGATWPW